MIINDRAFGVAALLLVVLIWSAVGYVLWNYMDMDCDYKSRTVSGIIGAGVPILMLGLGVLPAKLSSNY